MCSVRNLRHPQAVLHQILGAVPSTLNGVRTQRVLGADPQSTRVLTPSRQGSRARSWAYRGRELDKQGGQVPAVQDLVVGYPWIVAYGDTRGSFAGLRTNQLVQVAMAYARPFDDGVQSNRIKDSPSGKGLGVRWNVAAPTSRRLATACSG